jgi:hypothetical protein
METSPKFALYLRKESRIETLRSYSVCCFAGFRFGSHLGV